MLILGPGIDWTFALPIRIKIEAKFYELLCNDALVNTMAISGYV